MAKKTPQYNPHYTGLFKRMVFSKYDAMLIAYLNDMTHTHTDQLQIKMCRKKFIKILEGHFVSLELADFLKYTKYLIIKGKLRKWTKLKSRTSIY